MNEYCVMHNGNNIHTTRNETEAVCFAIGYGADKVLEVFYDGETEIGCETIWENEKN